MSLAWSFDRSTIHETRVSITVCPLLRTISPEPDIAVAIAADRRTLGRPTIAVVVVVVVASVSASDTTGSSSVSGYRASTTDVSGGTVSS